MEQIKLKSLSKEQIKDMIATLTERLVIIETKEKNTIKSPSYRKEKTICDICGGKYSHYNKPMHAKAQKHIVAVRNNDSIRRLARSKTIASRIAIPDDL
jgi:hypothetical protein